MNRAKVIGAMVVVVVGASNAKAAIFDSNDLSLLSYQSADGNNITTDTSTGLEWLDIDTTTSITINDMNSRLGQGELREFRYATVAEVNIFFNNLGLPTRPLLESGDSLFTPDPFSNLFMSARSHTGETYSNPTAHPKALGSTSDRVDITRAVGVYYSGIDYGTSSARLLTSAYAINDTAINSAFGSWLVRPVPEPASLLLLALGGLAMLQKGRKISGKTRKGADK